GAAAGTGTVAGGEAGAAATATRARSARGRRGLGCWREGGAGAWVWREGGARRTGGSGPSGSGTGAGATGGSGTKNSPNSLTSAVKSLTVRPTMRLRTRPHVQVRCAAARAANASAWLNSTAVLSPWSMPHSRKCSTRFWSEVMPVTASQLRVTSPVIMGGLLGRGGGVLEVSSDESVYHGMVFVRSLQGIG